MKVRRFYPRQVLRRLQGDHQGIDAGKRAALMYVMRKGRKLGYSVSCGPTASAEDLLRTTSAAQAEAVLANSPFRIALIPRV